MGSEQPNTYERLALAFLTQGSGQGGFTAGEIAHQIGWGHDRSMMAQARHSILMPMLAKGWLAPLDDKKPMIFTATNAGRSALARSTQDEGER